MYKLGDSIARWKVGIATIGEGHDVLVWILPGREGTHSTSNTWPTPDGCTGSINIKMPTAAQLTTNWSTWL